MLSVSEARSLLNRDADPRLSSLNPYHNSTHVASPNIILGPRGHIVMAEEVAAAERTPIRTRRVAPACDLYYF